MPYPNLMFGKPEAHGLAFSYRPVAENDFHIPKSLQTILTEIEEDVYKCKFEDMLTLQQTNLQHWAEQGILLLNTALTVNHKEPGSHIKLWKPFTSYVIQYLNQNNPGLIWMLWGNDAKAFKEKLNNNHHILEAGHPSPLNCNPLTKFKGCKHFSKANEIIEKQNGKEFKITW